MSPPRSARFEIPADETIGDDEPGTIPASIVGCFDVRSTLRRCPVRHGRA